MSAASPRFRETSRGHIMGLNNGMMKMIFSIKTRRLLGVHIVGEGATELIHIGQAVLNPEGDDRLFHREHLQLPHVSRGLQDRRPGRLEPHAEPAAGDPRGDRGGGGLIRARHPRRNWTSRGFT